MIAIYSRKSKFTGRGESIDNQIEICKKYLYDRELIKTDKDIICFEDEGYSGKNTDRPQFKLMEKLIESKKISILVCYKLDRITRSVIDFELLKKNLKKYNVEFISVKEQFDTTTPTGEAMMSMITVIAQLERATIAERIRDNMLMLAKDGRWLGGITPTGFLSEKVDYQDRHGKTRTCYKLVPIEDELKIVKLIFTKYLEEKSITKVETFLMNNDIKSKNNADFSRYTIRYILSNPVYAIADEQLYSYLEENEYDVYEYDRFDGKYGAIGYNKTKQDDSSERFREPKDQIISVGYHEGIIDSDMWIKVNKLLLKNKSKSFYKSRSDTSKSLLVGLVKCTNCGSYMRPKLGRINKETNEYNFYYKCVRKEKSNGHKCNVENISGNLLDEYIINMLKDFLNDNSPIMQDLNSKKLELQELAESENCTESINCDKLNKIELSISNILRAIENAKNENVINALTNKLEQLYDEKERIENLMNEVEVSQLYNEFEQCNIQEYVDKLSKISSSSWDMMSLDYKRSIVNSVIESIAWDGEKIQVYFVGSKQIQAKTEQFVVDNIEKFSDFLHVNNNYD